MGDAVEAEFQAGWLRGVVTEVNDMSRKIRVTFNPGAEDEIVVTYTPREAAAELRKSQGQPAVASSPAKKRAARTASPTPSAAASCTSVRATPATALTRAARTTSPTPSAASTTSARVTAAELGVKVGALAMGDAVEAEFLAGWLRGEVTEVSEKSRRIRVTFNPGAEDEMVVAYTPREAVAELRKARGEAAYSGALTAARKPVTSSGAQRREKSSTPEPAEAASSAAAPSDGDVRAGKRRRVSIPEPAHESADGAAADIEAGDDITPEVLPEK